MSNNKKIGEIDKFIIELTQKNRLIGQTETFHPKTHKITSSVCGLTAFSVTHAKTFKMLERRRHMSKISFIKIEKIMLSRQNLIKIESKFLRIVDAE